MSRLGFLPVLGWCALGLWLGSDAGPGALGGYFMPLGAMPVLGWWAVRLFIHITRPGPRPPAGRRWANVTRWCVEPLLVALLLTSLHYRLPFLLRFARNEAAFRKRVAVVLAGNKTPPGNRAGTFRVQETDMLPGGVVRMITARDFLDHAGVVYSPAGPPPVVSEDTYTHLWGPWWHWHQSW